MPDTKFDAILAPWISGGEVVAKRVHAEFGDVLVLVKRNGTYNVYRAFTIGTTGNLSADLTDATAEQAINYLFEKVEF